MTDRRIRLGVIVMEDDYAVEGTPEVLATKQVTYPWVMNEDPNFWPVPIHTAIAKGADADALLGGTEAGARGVADAASRLADHTQLIIGNCGFMWTASARVAESVGTPTITSGLDFLDLALRMTNQPVGVITYCQESLEPLLADHPGRDRIRLLGLRDLPDWSAISPADWWDRGGWTFDGLRTQLIERLTGALAAGGVFEHVRILILECTALPNFRSDIRAASGLPVLDVVSFAAAAIS